MLVFRCTQKLLRYVGQKGVDDSGVEDTSTLGEWYANLVEIGGRRRILFVNAATRLPVFVPAGPLESVISEFGVRLADLLDDIGIHEDDIDRELRAMEAVTIARATDRSVLGTMNLISRELHHLQEVAEIAGEDSDFNAEWHFAHEPQSPIGWRHPAAFVRMAFAEERPYVPPVEIAREYLRVEEVALHEWEFRYDRIDPETSEMLLVALDADRQYRTREAQTMLALLIRDYPEFIDAYHYLAAMHARARRDEEAYDLWWYAVEIGRSALPDSFQIGTDRLRWGLLHNRPFLRACHGLALDWERRGVDERALELYRDLLEFNPEDNQGVRALLTSAYLRRDDREAALEICERFPDDTLPEIVYGRVLALLRLGRNTDARRALARAVNARPLVARELKATRHSKPTPYQERDYVADSYQEAAYYWDDCGELWEATPGALPFVRHYLADHPIPRRPAPDNVIQFPGRERD